MRTNPVRIGTATLGAILTVLVAACTPTHDAVPMPSTGSATPTPGPVDFALTISPKNGAKSLPVSTEVGLSVRAGRITSVVVTAAGDQAKVRGQLRADGSSWVPDAPLAFATRYTAAVTAVSSDSATVATRTTSFTTMSRPAATTGTGLYLFDGQSVGVAMPVVVEFHPPVPASARAGVQRRLFVTTNPPQPGVWHWASGSQAWYRAPNHWRPGTTITVRTGLAGHPTGQGRFGDLDRTATVTVAAGVALIVDNATKRLTVHKNGRLVRTIPVSLGKPSTPSSSGNLVIMSKERSTIFDTTDEGPGGYRLRIEFALRLTWGGEFIHAAPWSVQDQGRRNVSHGCVNMSSEHARWLFDTVHIGDPVTVRGTEVDIAAGNGWTAWDLSWEKYIRGSALPVPPELATTSSAINPAASAGASAASDTPGPVTPSPVR